MYISLNSMLAKLNHHIHVCGVQRWLWTSVGCVGRIDVTMQMTFGELYDAHCYRSHHSQCHTFVFVTFLSSNANGFLSSSFLMCIHFACIKIENWRCREFVRLYMAKYAINWYIRHTTYDIRSKIQYSNELRYEKLIKFSQWPVRRT